MLRQLKYAQLLNDYEHYIDYNKDNVEDINRMMVELYRKTKKIAYHYTKHGIITDEFIFFAKRLLQLEKKLPLHFILENKPVFNYDYKLNNINLENPKETLEYLVNYARYQLVSEFLPNKDISKIEINDYSLQSFCSFACYYIQQFCDLNHISCKTYTIYPAFYESKNIYGKGFNHKFCLITLGDESYIIDITYSQFCTLFRNNLESLGIPLFGGCNPGIYMLLDKERKKLAIDLMKNGYIKATPENIKLYFDGFALSFRNGLYYEYVSSKFSTTYSANDYINFLEGKDSQLNHEPEECLGPQKKIMKKQLNF